jgi:hypothetical protein
MPQDDSHSAVKRASPRPKRWDLTRAGLGWWAGELVRRLAAMRREHPVLRARNMYPASWPSDRRSPYEDGYGIDADRQVVVFHVPLATAVGRQRCSNARIVGAGRHAGRHAKRPPGFSGRPFLCGCVGERELSEAD